MPDVKAEAAAGDVVSDSAGVDRPTLGRLFGMAAIATAGSMVTDKAAGCWGGREGEDTCVWPNAVGRAKLGMAAGAGRLGRVVGRCGKPEMKLRKVMEVNDVIFQLLGSQRCNPTIITNRNDSLKK